MTDPIVIVVPGEPEPYRERSKTIIGRRTWSYRVPEVRAAQETIRWHAKLAMMGREMLRGPIKLQVTVFMRIPSSWPKGRQAAALEGEELPISTRGGDLTNFVKTIEDGLSGLVFEDDSRVCRQENIKLYDDGAGPRLEIIVGPWAVR